MYFVMTLPDLLRSDATRTFVCQTPSINNSMQAAAPMKQHCDLSYGSTVGGNHLMGDELVLGFLDSLFTFFVAVKRLPQ
jgi:hypothetical protein